MEYRGCVPYSYGIEIAKEFLSKDLWVGLGGGSIVWVDLPPPYPSRTFTEIQDLETVVYIDRKRLVRLDPLGEIEAHGTRYSYVNPNQAISTLVTQEAFYLYLEASIPIDSILPTNTFKLISILYDLDLTITPLKEKYYITQATNITDYKLIWIGTIAPLELNTVEKRLQFIIPFN